MKTKKIKPVKCWVAVDEGGHVYVCTVSTEKKTTFLNGLNELFLDGKVMPAEIRVLQGKRKKSE